MARNRKIIGNRLFTPPSYRWLFLGIFAILFALTIYALVEYFADQGRDPLQALFDSELDHEVFAAIVQIIAAEGSFCRINC